MKYFTTYFPDTDLDDIAEWLNRWSFLINENFVHIVPDNTPDGGFHVMYKGRRQIGACEEPTKKEKEETLWT